MKYTVTTVKKYCPYCKHHLDTEVRGLFTPLKSLLAVLVFPVSITLLVIKYLGFKNPDIPNIGPKFEACPNCMQLIRTDNMAVEDLKGQELLNHSFKVWFYFCYSLGTLFGLSMLYLIMQELPLVSVWGLILLITFVGILAIVLTYRIKLARCKDSRIVYPVKIALNKTMMVDFNINTTQNAYCRNCGDKLYKDGNFCMKCGAERKTQ